MNITDLVPQAPKYAWPMSFSRRRTLYNCPQAFINQYVNRKPRGPVKNQHLFDIGTFVHNVLEAMVKYKMPMEKFNNLWNTMETNYSVAKTHREEVRAFYPYTKEICKRVYTFIDKYNAEYWPEFVLNMTKNGQYTNKKIWSTLMFSGFIDLLVRVGDKLIIIDYKTEAYKNDNKHLQTQLNLYTYFLFKLYPEIQSITGAGAYIKSNDIIFYTPVKRETNLQAINEEIEDMFVQYVHDVNNLDIHQNKEECGTKEHCQWCSFLNSK